VAQYFDRALADLGVARRAIRPPSELLARDPHSASFDTSLDSAAAMGPQRLISVNPPEDPAGPAHRVIRLRDRDGYLVVLAGPDGERRGPIRVLRDRRECPA